MSGLKERQGAVDVVCPGGPYQMGLAQGAALRQKVRDGREALSRLEAFRLEQPRWMPYPMFRLLAERKARGLLEKALERDYPEMTSRLAGLADGAGLPRQALLLVNALEPLMSSVRGRVVRPCPGACSAVAVGAQRSATGEPVIAKNFDYLPLVQPYYAIRESRPRLGMRSLEFTVAGLAGAVDGVNEAGLCITYNYAYTTDDSPATGTISMLISEALGRCETVVRAADYIESRPRWGAGLLMLADASGDIASLEVAGTRCRLRRDEGHGMLCHTNAFSCGPMQEIEVAADAIFTAQAPAALRGRRVRESAERRDARLQELLAGAGPLGPDELTAVLADHGADGVPGDYTLCVHGSYWSTTACLQLFPASRRLRVSYSRACQADFVELAL